MQRLLFQLCQFLLVRRLADNGTRVVTVGSEFTTEILCRTAVKEVTITAILVQTWKCR